MSIRTSLFHGTALAVVALISPSAAFAQDQAPGPAAQQAKSEPAPPQDAGEITVTARRVNERLRDVPGTVAVFDEKALEQSRVRTGKDAIQLTSGVSIVSGADNYADVQVNVRGLNGARDGESNVAVVVDGILKSSKAALVQNQGPLQQLEVLKGPQGAIYGRNAAAGVFVLTTKKPGDHVEGSITASGGNNATASVNGYVSAPITSSLGVTVAGNWGQTDGFYRNVFLPSAVNQQLYPGNSRNAAAVDANRQWDIYGRLYFQPSSRTSFDLKARYGQLRGSAINFQAVFALPTLAQATGVRAFYQDVNSHVPVYASNIEPRSVQNNFEISLHGSHEFDWATLSGYVSHNNFKNRLNADGTSGTFGFFAAEPRCIATTAALTGYRVEAPFGVGGGAFLPPYSPTTCDGTLYEQHDQRDTSVELRLASPIKAPLQWQAGFYYLNVRRFDCVSLELDTGNGFDPRCVSTNPLTHTEEVAADITRNNVYSGFASAEYKFAQDRAKIGFALRYDVEQKTSTSAVPVAGRTLYVGNVLTGHPNGTPTQPANYYLNAGLDPAYNPSGLLPERRATYRQVQPKVTLSYKFSEDVTGFANWGIGFKAGGFNPGGSSSIINGFFVNTIGANVHPNETYPAETLNTFEAGLKGRTLARKLNFEATGYYTIDKNLQFFELFVGPFGILREVENVDRVDLYGFEVSADFRPVRAWQLFGSFNLTESEIKRNSIRPNSVGNKAPTTPDFTINGGTQVDFPISNGLKFTGRADVRVTGPTYFHVIQNNTVPNIFSSLVGNGNFSRTRRSTYTTVNLRAGIEYHNLSVTGYVSNLFDTSYLREVIVAPEFGGAFTSPGDRRSYGIEVGFKF